jgi:hypothetical protein
MMMFKILVLFVLVLFPAIEAKEKQSKIEALSETHSQYPKVKKGFKFDRKEAWNLLVKSAKENDEIKVVFTRNSAWIIDGKYFFPREEVMKVFNQKFREWGVYVDGKTGEVKVVNTSRIIKLRTKNDE